MQIGFNRRFDPSFRRVHDVVASGKIGRAHILRIMSRDPAPPPLAYVKVSGGILSNANSISTSLPLNFFMERYAGSFGAEMKAFVTSIVEDKTPPVTGIDGRIPVVMGIAAKMSYAEKRLVKLSEVDHV